MSLFVVGSASRVTSNIITQLARNGQYSKITISDILPSYNNFYRYYRLQRDLRNLQVNVQLDLTKLHEISNIYEGNNFDDVLFVTHDYYSHVSSKTRLMELTASIWKQKKNLYFATPVEYDHYGFVNPQNNYAQAHQKVMEIAPQSTIIRSDIQDKTETFAYIKSVKGWIDGQIYNFKAKNGFNPKVVSSTKYAETVANLMKDKAQGKQILVQGEKSLSENEVEIDRSIQKHEYAHATTNIAELTAKYNGLIGQGCSLATSQ